MDYQPIRRKPYPRPRLDEDLILSWADAHFERLGVWPGKDRSGSVDGHSGETWGAIDHALKKGYRGLLLGSSLSLLLKERRGVQLQGDKPQLTVDQILDWMDRHLKSYGTYPHVRDGAIDGTDCETWSGVDQALQAGLRGLPATSSLAKLLQERRGKRNTAAPSGLSVDLVLSWMDEHHSRTGRWPTQTTGEVRAAPLERWSYIDKALRNGRRGLPGESSLVQLAILYRGRKSIVTSVAPLDIEQIAEWMAAYALRHGKYPTKRSNTIEESPEDNWEAVDAALRNGHRSLPGRQTLAQLRSELIAEGRLPLVKSRRSK